MSERAQLRQAIKHYKRQLALEPRHLEHLQQISRLLVEAGKPKDAAVYLVTRARVLAELGAHAAAVEDCRSALALHRRVRGGKALSDELEQLRLRREAAAQAQALATQQRMQALGAQGGSMYGAQGPYVTQSLRVTSLPQGPRPGERVVDASELLVARAKPRPPSTPQAPTLLAPASPQAPAPLAPSDRVYDASELLAVRGGQSLLESINQEEAHVHASPRALPAPATRTLGFEDRATLQAPPSEVMIRTLGFEQRPLWADDPAELTRMETPAAATRKVEAQARSKEGSIEMERRSIEASLEAEMAQLEAQSRLEASMERRALQDSIDRGFDSLDEGIMTLQSIDLEPPTRPPSAAEAPFFDGAADFSPPPRVGALPPPVTGSSLFDVPVFDASQVEMTQITAPPLGRRRPTPASSIPVPERPRPRFKTPSGASVAPRPTPAPSGPRPTSNPSAFAATSRGSILSYSTGSFSTDDALIGADLDDETQLYQALPSLSSEQGALRARPRALSVQPEQIEAEMAIDPRTNEVRTIDSSVEEREWEDAFGAFLESPPAWNASAKRLQGAVRANLEGSSEQGALSSAGNASAKRSQGVVRANQEGSSEQGALAPAWNASAKRLQGVVRANQEGSSEQGALSPSVSSRIELRFPLLDGLPKRELEATLNSARVTRFMAGETIVDNGQPFDGVYLLMEGLVRVQFNGINGPTFAAGAIFGLLETFFGGPWSQRLITDYPSELFQIPKRRFEQILRQFPRLERSLREEAERRQLISLLAKSTLFRSLNAHAMSALAARCNPRVFGTGEALFDEDGLGGLYLVVRGRVELSDEDGVLANFKSGDCVGLRSALKIPLRGAEARATEPTEVQHIPRGEIEHLLRDPNVRLAFEQAVKIRR
ncbi:cyclic nucleotide-binding domain-containing protein [Myxococcota bacterium]|nr:cyclic nucleotide-binding domain-containing protein [Myxococcota bacterium]